MRVKFQTQDIKSGEIREEETTVASMETAVAELKVRYSDDGKLAVFGVREVGKDGKRKQAELTSECWGVQVLGISACSDCDFINTTECGGVEIRTIKTGWGKGLRVFGLDKDSGRKRAVRAAMDKRPAIK